MLGFGLWLQALDAAALETDIIALRQEGRAFQRSAVTRNGEHIAVEGSAMGSQAIVRIRDVTGDARALAELSARHAAIAEELARIGALMQNLEHPAWIRDEMGHLVWVNTAYARAVDAETPDDAVRQHLEFLDASTRSSAEKIRAKDIYRARVHAVARGQRRTFDVMETMAGTGSAGIAIDVSDIEEIQAEMSRRVDAHRRTLDELATAVAIFAADGTLVFYNQAYRQLWGLDPAFLDQNPADAQILEHLRASRLLPEQADFRGWKAKLHEAYRAIEPTEHWWHLPDGRTIRTVQTPNPEGGVTYLFDDVTERLNLESRFNALMRVQSETLDHLREGVVVFGTDGRLKLCNPAFAALWNVPPKSLEAEPHADELFALFKPGRNDAEAWARVRSSLTSIDDHRTVQSARIERDDGIILDATTVPLPDGATLVTFTDVTARVGMERALTERNDALEAAAQIKSDFVKNVSYELRSPLTNIIGFTQLLGDATIGPLNEKQHEYAEHILASSAALLTIINDILDLATIDAGAMELELVEVDIAATMEAAAEGVRDRLSEASLTLDIVAPRDGGTFIADEKRVRQVLFNLLSNAIGFSPKGATVTLAADRHEDTVVFHVTDQGRGISADMLERVFDRFESHTEGSRHRGVGLGLPLVRSLVELHGGHVSIESTPEKGTTVTCSFPAVAIARRVAAE